MPSFNSAWGPWHWENAAFKYTNGPAQLGFSTRENNLLWLLVDKVKQRSCPASYTKSMQMLIVSQTLDFPSEWRYAHQADEHREPFRPTQHRQLPVTCETCNVWFLPQFSDCNRFSHSYQWSIVSAPRDGFSRYVCVFVWFLDDRHILSHMLQHSPHCVCAVSV